MTAAPVVVVAETDQDEPTHSTLECVEEASDIVRGRGGIVHAVHPAAPGTSAAALAETLAAHGADRMTLVEHEALAQFSADAWLEALEPVLRTTAPMLILAPDSGYGRAWLPRLSLRWRMPLVTNCSRAKLVDEGYPEAFRFCHDGRTHERLIWPRGTLVGIMMAPRVRGVAGPRPGRRAEVDTVRPALDPAACRDRTFRTLPPDPRTVDLSEAERIVSGGLGVGGPEGMAQLRRLAELLGATLGGTRVAADHGWLPADRFIGTTGKIVAPKLYLAFGVSGAGQHVAGMAGSETVIAINTDRTAPLLKLADLGVVGDLHQIVPVLIQKLEALTAAEAPAETPPAPEIQVHSAMPIPNELQAAPESLQPEATPFEGSPQADPPIADPPVAEPLAAERPRWRAAS